MRLIHGLEALPPQRLYAATVGSYDGVHLGHRVLLERTRDEARKIGGESLVVTFDPHPRLALDPRCGMRLLTTKAEKLRLLEQAGIENLLIIPFDHAFSRMAPADFVRLLVERLGVRSLVVGYDHRFGRDKSGSRELLERLKDGLGLQIIEVAEQEALGEHVSSTAVRHLIEAGETTHAARLLGHPYLLIASCDEAGNVVAPDHKLLPKEGLYAIRWGATKGHLMIDNRGLRLTPVPRTREEIILEFIE